MRDSTQWGYRLYNCFMIPRYDAMPCRETGELNSSVAIKLQEVQIRFPTDNLSLYKTFGYTTYGYRHDMAHGVATRCGRHQVSQRHSSDLR